VKGINPSFSRLNKYVITRFNSSYWSTLILIKLQKEWGISLAVKVLEKENIEGLLAHLSDSHRVFGPVTRRNHVSFQEVSGADELYLDYVTTTQPPKKFFHRSETLIRYEGNGGLSTPSLESETPILLFGVHPCDLNAILR